MQTWKISKNIFRYGDLVAKELKNVFIKKDVAEKLDHNHLITNVNVIDTSLKNQLQQKN